MSPSRSWLRKSLKQWRARAKEAAAKIALRRRQLAAAGPEVMYDSVSLDAIPANAKAVAGYVGGRWPTFDKLKLRWPRARHVSIAVASSQNAECLDIEPGDATPDKAPEWVRRQQARGVKRPILYTSASQLQALVNLLERHGIGRGEYRLWSAHYTHKAHTCGPACGFGIKVGADATQWTNMAMGRNLDQSLCRPSFWQGR